MSEGWRRGRDSNPWKPFDFNGFQDRRLKPLGHLSGLTASVKSDVKLQTSPFDDLLRSHIFSQNFRHDDGPVLLLVILENRD